MTSPNDTTQPIERISSRTLTTALPVLSPGTGRRRAPGRYARLRETARRAATTHHLGEIWGAVWPPMLGVVLGAIIATLFALGALELWLNS